MMSLIDNKGRLGDFEVEVVGVEQVNHVHCLGRDFGLSHKPHIECTHSAGMLLENVEAVPLVLDQVGVLVCERAHQSHHRLVRCVAEHVRSKDDGWLLCTGKRCSKLSFQIFDIFERGAQMVVFDGEVVGLAHHTDLTTVEQPSFSQPCLQQGCFVTDVAANQHHGIGFFHCGDSGVQHIGPSQISNMSSTLWHGFQDKVVGAQRMEQVLDRHH
eukprot:Lithocolla_globosa_v1_NODE_1848_length_2298_cov_11.398128.p3 type:complete len:214 gc:universal NODE_1848_length_2298_cov_11.398128:517-1158(+)